MQRRPRKPFKQNLIVRGVNSCTTILRTPVRVALSSIMAFSMAACNPSSTTNNGPTVNQFGGDKNDKGGYEGSGGTGDGGGGQGILCSSETKNPEFRDKLFVRDLFEAKYNSKLALKTLSDGKAQDASVVTDEAYAVLLASLKSYFGPAMYALDIGEEKFWKEFVRNISFISEDAQLYPSKDANSPIALPAGCKISQIAYWDDTAGAQENGTLYVDRNQWEKLDQLNKIALLAHEYFFKEARRAGYKNSDAVRSKIGALFSVKGPEALFKNWEPATSIKNKDVLPKDPEGFRLCQGQVESDSTAKLFLYQYKGKDHNIHFVIPYISSATVNLSSLGNTEFTTPGNNEVIQATSNLWIATPDLKYEDLRRYQNDYKETHPLDIQYFGSGLYGQGSRYVSDIPTLLLQNVNLLKNQKQALWTNYLKTASGNLQITIENPVLAGSPTPSLRGEEHAQIIQNYFIKALKNEVSASNFEIAEPEFLTAIAVLEKEIKDAQVTGVYPKNFPKWNTALVKFFERALNKTYSAEDKENIKYEFAISFPSYLYKARYNMLSLSELKLYGLDVNNDEQVKSSKGSLVVKSAISTVSFDLSCVDYDAVDAFLTNKDSKFATASPQENNSELDLNLPYNLIKDGFSEEELPKIENILTETINVGKIGVGSGALPSAECSSSRGKVDTCNIDIFISKFELAKSMTAQSCKFRNPNLKNLEPANAHSQESLACLIIGFPEDKSHFIVWLETRTERHSWPLIRLAKQIAAPPEKIQVIEEEY